MIFGDGEQSRDFTYVENVVDANIAALEAAGVGGRIYNIACGHRITLNELAQSLRDEIGAEVEVDARAGAAGRRPPLGRRRQRSPATELGYEPAIALDEGCVDGRALRRDAGSRELQRAMPAARRRSEPSSPSGPAACGPPPSRRDGTQLPDHRRRRLHRLAPGRGACRSATRRARIVILDDLSTGACENIEHLLDDDRVQLRRGLGDRRRAGR